MNREAGYTVTELLIALGLAATVLAIAVPLYQNYQSSAKDAALLAHMTELEEPLVTYTLTHDPIAVCQDYASEVNLPTLANPMVDMQLSFSPISPTDATKGYRASLVVSADATQDLQVARDVHELMSDRSRVSAGAVLTDTFVAYEIPLTPGNDPFCSAMSLTASVATSTGTGVSAQMTRATGGVPAATAPQISFSFTTQQEVVEFGSSGTGSVINNGPLKTAGDMQELAVEFNVIGGPQVATSGIHGATFLSYGVSGNSDEFYVWNPANLTVRIHNVEYATGIDTTADSQTHRYTVLWSAATGVLQVLVDGAVKYTKSGVAKGYAIPGGGVLALAQDQDNFQIEDGSHGGDHGFAPQDAFHGQIFSASLATRTPDAASLANAPLASLIDASNGLVTNIQIENGQIRDVTGNHALTVHGDVNRHMVSVDASVAVPNPGATLTLQVDAKASGTDSLIDLKLVGLMPGTQVSDSLGNTGSGASISIFGWQLSGITAQLPAGVRENMNIGVIATAKGRRGDLATAEQYQPLVLDPTGAIPPRIN